MREIYEIYIYKFDERQYRRKKKNDIYLLGLKINKDDDAVT